MESQRSDNTTRVEAAPPVGGEMAVDIPLDRLKPNPKQPRAFFDELEHKWLTESIATEGVLQPILICPDEDGQFLIIAGERRYRAAKAAGLASIPAVVRSEVAERPLSERDVQRMALVENLQRAELNDFEVAVGVTEHLRKELGLESVEEVARLLRRMHNKTLREGEEERAEQVETIFRQLGRLRVSFTVNQLLVLSLHPDLQQQLRQGKLDLSKARLLNRVKDNEVRKHLMWQAIVNDWSTALLKREIADLDKVKERTMEGEVRRAEIAKRLTVTRSAYVKVRRQLPDETLAEIEELIERLDALVGVQKETEGELSEEEGLAA